MSRIKERISTLVSNHLPDFVEENHTTFLTFVESYYKFLEQDQNAFELIQNAKKYNDIERKLTLFHAHAVNQSLKSRSLRSK